MRVWRICRKPFATETLQGKGGLYVEGRWHFKGTPIVYTSATLSLAALETLVHTDPDLLPDDLVSVEIEIPDSVSIEKIGAHELPKNWTAIPFPKTLQEKGKKWAQQARHAVLRVPSAIIPIEHNYIINPLCPAAKYIKQIAIKAFCFDRRLLKRVADT